MSTTLRTCAAALFLLLATHAPATAQPLELYSPDSTLQIAFSLDGGTPSYSVQRLQRFVIEPSALGVVLRDAHLDRNLRLVDSAQRSFDETWTQPWGEQKDIRNRYNELRVVLEEADEDPVRLDIVFRAFEDGFGFRYEWPEQDHLDSLVILDEKSEFALTGDHTAWWIPAYQDNRYEYLYNETPLSAIDTVHTPVTMETADGLYLSFHEAALVDFASMTLAPTESFTLEADLVPWPDGVKVRADLPHVSPWRTVQIGDTPGELITSYLILNLNEPNQLGDVSWVDPGKYVGIWWEMHLETGTWGSGPKHAATTENTKRYMDFAAEHGFEGVLVEGWNQGWDGPWSDAGMHIDFLTPYPDFDIEEVTRYGAGKGVHLIGHHETGAWISTYEEQMEDAYDMYQRLGVRAIKSGYVGRRLYADGQVYWHHGQFGVNHYNRAVVEAAKRKIMLNVHEPIKDTGLRRTWPNLMSREGARGQEYNAWSADGGNPPEHETILPFTRMLSGPMDFTPGIFDLHFPQARPNNRVNTTLAKQLALYVVLYSPLHMAADLPENYEANPEAFRFIEDVPTDWENTRVLHARIGDYVTIVRQERDGEDWYLGSVTDDTGRTLEAPLSFLEPGRTYVAEYYSDGPMADWEDNPYAMDIGSVLVDSSTMWTIRLAPGGGQAVRFRPATDEDAGLPRHP